MKTPEDFLKEAIGEIRWNLDGSVTRAQLKFAMEQYAKYYHETEVKKLNIHSVMQAEGSDVSEGAAVASEGEEKCVCGGFDEGYKRGYQDATSEAIEEIHKNYKPRA